MFASLPAVSVGHNPETLPPGALSVLHDSAGTARAAARELGVEVPGELAVLGMDNLEELCESTLPTLSSIEPDFRRAGALAVRALVGQEGPSGGAARGGEWVYGDLGIVRRASTRPLASHDAGYCRSQLSSSW